MTDSSTGGYLAPAGSPAPLEDDALDNFLGDVVAGITGLNRDTQVFPRWQPEPPNFPPGDWVAFGITNRQSDTFAVEQHDSADPGRDILIRHEELELLCSFYGANCQSNGAVLRDGLQVAQNREALFLAGMGVKSVGPLTRAPEMIKNRWIARTDLTIWVRRVVQRTYPVLNLASGQATLVAGPVTTPIIATP